jgi:hypothetical protein
MLDEFHHGRAIFDQRFEANRRCFEDDGTAILEVGIRSVI